jgi:hypothetical protein
MLKTNAPERQAMLLRLTLAAVGMGMLVFTWVRILQWAGGPAEP